MSKVGKTAMNKQAKIRALEARIATLEARIAKKASMMTRPKSIQGLVWHPMDSEEKDLPKDVKIPRWLQKEWYAILENTYQNDLEPLIHEWLWKTYEATPVKWRQISTF